MYRKSGGTEDIETGTARIEAIKGNTIAWNQIINGNNTIGNNAIISNKTTNGFTLTAPASSADKSAVMTGVFKTGHVYYYAFDYTSTLAFSTQDMNSGGGKKPATSTFSHISKIGACISSGYTNFYWYLYSTTSEEWVLVVKNLVCFDLTLIYGAGNEPTSVEQFEADYQRWFGKPLTYEPYDVGSLRNVKMSAIKTTGFNQWDEEWETGAFNMTTGEKINSDNRVRSKNVIKIFPSTAYHFVRINSNEDGSIENILWYDSNMNFLYREVYVNNKTKISPNNAAYLNFNYYGTTYNHDICINISDQSKNGTYEPYKENIASLPITTLTGKLNGQGESVTIFPDGMKSAGNIHDEIFVDNGIVKAIKRVGAVDLGSRTWTKAETSSTHYWFSASLSNAKRAISSTSKANIICPMYETKSESTVYSGNVGVAIHHDVPQIKVCDERYSSASDFKSAMNGVMFYYELEAPLVYELDITPQDLQKRYIGNDPVVRVLKGDTLLWEANN